MIKKYLSAEVKSVNQEDGTFEFVASSGKVDRIGDSIDPKGWFLTNYKKNPVILWSHSTGGMFGGVAVPPVAKADKVWIEDGKELKIKGHFAETPFAQELKTLVEGGFLNAVSVGFLPLIEEQKGDIEIENKMYRRATDEEIKKGIYDSEYGEQFTKQELLEVSWVSVPALPQALVSARKMNLDLVTKALETEIKENPKEEEKETETEKETEIKKEIETKEKETYDCECLDCGNKMTTEKHCADIKCSKCGGEMRRVERPGPGKELTVEQFDKIKDFISETEKAISFLKGLFPKTEATPADDTKGRISEKKIKSQTIIDREAEIKLLRLADKAIEALLRKLRQKK